MKIIGILNLLGGLALFLYGMHMMSQGLENAAGSKMKQILERLTKNRFLGVFIGAGITALIQSSSATTVMVVGFVNSGIMTLEQAVWIIMGANIGTTITGQLIALNVGMLAPVITFLGVVMVVFFRKPLWHYIGSILGGLGILFIGMNMMSTAMEPLKDSELFVRCITHFSNPLVGIAVGTIFTAAIQSSSASVGVLQALAVSGTIPFSSAVYVLFGQNIGTCITALLASIGTSRNAKRTTVIHLSFNIIGTVLFTLFCYFTPLVQWVAQITPNHPASQIANMHTLFNIVTTILLLPFGYALAWLACRILPDDEEKEVVEEEKPIQFTSLVIREGSIGNVVISLRQVEEEIEKMLEAALENVMLSLQAFARNDASVMERVQVKEEQIDCMNNEIASYISHVLTNSMNENESRAFHAYYKIAGNIERISDHAMNICGYCEKIEEKDITFSNQANAELAIILDISQETKDLLENREMDAKAALLLMEQMEEQIDKITEEYRGEMMNRITRSVCSGAESIFYSEMLTDFERIGDHALNIAQEMEVISRCHGELGWV